MRIDGLSLDFFRNYVHLDAAFDPNINVIYGDNAQGKTNLLEAVAYLSTASSHRARYDRELIQFGVDHAFVKAEVSARGRDFTLEARLSRGQRRQLYSNGVRLKTAGELAGILTTVLFCPEALYLIREGGAARRWRACQAATAARRSSPLWTYRYTRRANWGSGPLGKAAPPCWYPSESWGSTAKIRA